MSIFLWRGRLPPIGPPSNTAGITRSARTICLPAWPALQWRMPEPTRQKITFVEMRAAGVRGLLIYCSDYKCGHWTAISGDRWPDQVRLSDIEPLFTCQTCGRKGADDRPDWHSVEEYA
jgi:hypothetical protein